MDKEGGYNISQGWLRIRVGLPAKKGPERIVWDRQLFIHGGRYGNEQKRTHGCMRADDQELEVLAANMIELRREGDPVTTLTVR
jgi:hypothetical protein